MRHASRTRYRPAGPLSSLQLREHALDLYRQQLLAGAVGHLAAVGKSTVPQGDVEPAVADRSPCTPYHNGPIASSQRLQRSETARRHGRYSCFRGATHPLPFFERPKTVGKPRMPTREHSRRPPRQGSRDQRRRASSITASRESGPPERDLRGPVLPRPLGQRGSSRRGDRA